MVKIVSDNKKAEKYLRQIAKIVTQHGGLIDPDLEIHCRKDGISVHSPQNKTPRPLFRVPHNALIPFDHFDVQIKKDRFVLKDIKTGAPKHQIKLMQAMLALYNATNQLANFRQASPWIVYRNHPHILYHLLQSRKGADIREIQSLIDGELPLEDVEQKLFFKTRLLKCRLHKKFRKPVPVLLPLIDSLNHHILGSGFKSAYPVNGEAFLAVRYAPFEDQDECFAMYRRLDSLDSWLDYAFIDENAPVVRSIPLCIDLPNIGKIDIQGVDAMANKQQIPEHLQDVNFYMPVARIDPARQEADLTHLFIPQKNAPFSMRRILEYIIQTLQPDLPPSELEKAIFDAENVILDANKAFYKKLQDQEHTIENSNSLSKLTALQMLKIERYEMLCKL